jgi:hypothetical protein
MCFSPTEHANVQTDVHLCESAQRDRELHSQWSEILEHLHLGDYLQRIKLKKSSNLSNKRKENKSSEELSAAFISGGAL